MLKYNVRQRGRPESLGENCRLDLYQEILIWPLRGVVMCSKKGRIGDKN